jgi:hypothetical protein
VPEVLGHDLVQVVVERVVGLELVAAGDLPPLRDRERPRLDQLDQLPADASRVAGV